MSTIGLLLWCGFGLLLILFGARLVGILVMLTAPVAFAMINGWMWSQ